MTCRLSRSMLLFLGILSGGLAAQVPTPESFLGRPLGADFQLADWNEVSGYHRALAEASPRVLLETLGTTTEGRELLLVVISSEETLARLDEVRAQAAVLADPRGVSPERIEQALSRGRPVLFLSLGMHSNETAAPQFGLELAYRLATSDEEPYASARQRLVIVLLPCTNPDGLDHVVEWYRRTVGTPHEGSTLPRLYQLYAGHDNNRDWFALALQETRLVTRQLYQVWRPQVYWDVHQQGSTRERMFLPPFRDPLNPHIDPSIITAIDALGSRALHDMTQAGFTGLSTGVAYDMWWNGGNRNVPLRHNIVGLLTEAASVDLASPIFLAPGELRPPQGLPAYVPSNRFPAPWPGGWWRLRDIIDYEHAFARSLLGSLAREPRLWLETTLHAAQRAIARGTSETPRAWILPSDQRDTAAVRRLTDQLLLGGVELHVAGAPVSADGRTWPAGSLVILRAQPYGEYVQDLFATQHYPEGEPPYDVAGWTLPLLLGVHRVEVVGEPTSELTSQLRRVQSLEQALLAFPRLGVQEGGPASAAVRLDAVHGDSWRDVFARLARGERLDFATQGASAGHFLGGPGAPEAAAITLERLPRIGVYAPWSGDMDEGWLRWVFDTWGLPYASLRNEALRAGRLREDFDVLVLPGVGATQLDGGRASGSVPPEFAGGLDPEGAVAIDAFVRAGGRLVAVGDSSAWAITLFGLPLRDVTRGDAAKDFSCPGSVVRAVPVSGTALTAGLPESQAIFFSGSAAWALEKPAETAAGLGEARVHLRYAAERLLLSGWVRRPEVIAGQAAWVSVPVGQGSVQLFGFTPQYRGWSQAAFPLLFRALLLPN
ncbi:MAG: M14 family zinc carboxypeptidase [Planctomycetota bacterium]